MQEPPNIKILNRDR